jgi:hypothetical protein
MYRYSLHSHPLLLSVQTEVQIARDDLQQRNRELEHAALAQRSSEATYRAETSLLRTQLETLTEGLATTQGVVASLANQEVCREEVCREEVC